jgi:hypothetical protein
VKAKFIGALKRNPCSLGLIQVKLKLFTAK